MSQTTAQLIDNLVQPLTAAAGSNSAPAFAFTDDPNTGIYSPGADQLAISTGGSGRLFVDSNGATRIESVSVPLTSSRTVSGSNLGGLILRQSDTTNGNSLRIEYQSDTTGTGAASNVAFAGIEFAADTHDQATRAGSIRFRTSQGGVGDMQERLRITSDGKLGLGTSSPGSELEIAGGSSTAGPGAELRLTSKDQTIAAADEIIGSITFNNSDASGGMAGVMAKIDAASNRIFDGDNASGMNLRFFAGDKGDGVGTPPERMRITTEGRVGIGTTSVNDTLEVAGSAIIGKTGTANQIRFRRPSDSSIAGFFGYTDSGNDAKFEVRADGGGANVKLHANNASGFITAVIADSEKARIDSSGRLLVGTTSAKTNFENSTTTPQFQIESNTLNGASLSILRDNNDTGGPKLFLAHGRTDAGLVSAGDELGGLFFSGGDDSEFVTAASVAAAVDTTPGANNMPGRLSFSTTPSGSSTPTERMRIASDGHVSLFNGTSVFLRLNSASSAGTANRLIFGAHSATNVASGTECFRVFTNGDVQNTNDAYTGLSDIKLKENIVDAESQWDDFKAVRFRKYNFKEETGHETFTQLGVIAQELELVSPGLVTETPDLDENGEDLGTTTKSVKYSVLTKKALVALQEAMERIETLEAEVAALKGA